VLYRLRELIAADLAKVVFIAEGEKDVDRLVSLRLVATCNPGDAGKWKKQYSEFLRNRSVVIFPDNEEVGQKHAQDVAWSLMGVAKAVKIVNLPVLPPKGDISDWLDAGGTRDQLRDLVEAAPVFQPAMQRTVALQPEEWGTIESLGIANVPPFPVTVCRGAPLRHPRRRRALAAYGSHHHDAVGH
jgi:hypothetical protein